MKRAKQFAVVALAVVSVFPPRLAGLVCVCGLCLSACGQDDSPTYQGKTVEQWFQAYVTGAGTRVSPNAYSVRNGEFVLLPTMKEERDPIWLAFQALGETAVPYLCARLKIGAHESERTRLERRQAIELIHRLGECARVAGPALLALLPAASDEQTEEICSAVRAIHADRRLINEFLLGSNHHWSDAELVSFARRLGWNGDAVAHRLGDITNSTDRELAREALSLLEAAGAGAIPAVDQIAAALQSSDQELRYLAARCLAGPLTNTPAARWALQSVRADANPMVRNVALRALGGTKSDAPPSTGVK